MRIVHHLENSRSLRVLWMLEELGLDYERLIDAQEKGDLDAIKQSTAQLERAIRIQAKSISDKYVCPPHPAPRSGLPRCSATIV